MLCPEKKTPGVKPRPATVILTRQSCILQTANTQLNLNSWHFRNKFLLAVVRTTTHSRRETPKCRSTSISARPSRPRPPPLQNTPNPSITPTHSSTNQSLGPLPSIHSHSPENTVITTHPFLSYSILLIHKHKLVIPYHTIPTQFPPS